MSIDTSNKIAGLLAEVESHIRNLNALHARINCLPEHDLEGLRSQSHRAALVASDLEGALRELADTAETERVALYEARVSA